MEEPDPTSPAWLTSRNGLLRWGGRAWLVLGILLVAWVVWEIAGLLRLVLFPLVLALFPAALLQPIMDRFGGRGHRRRSLVALLATLGFVVVLGGIFTLLGWQVSNGWERLADRAGERWDELQRLVRDTPWMADIDFGRIVDDLSSSLELGSVAAAFGMGVATFAVELFLGLVAVFFYLRDGDQIAGFLRGLFPRGSRDDVRSIGRAAWGTVSGYIRAQALVALFDGTLFAVGLLILGVPLAIVLGVIVFFGAFIPVVGSIVAGAIGVAVAFLSGGLATGLIALGLILAIQEVEGDVLAPIVLGNELSIHPLAVLVAITAGASILGVFGAIIAAPLAASVYQAAIHLRRQERDPPQTPNSAR